MIGFVTVLFSGAVGGAVFWLTKDVAAGFAAATAYIAADIRINP